MARWVRSGIDSFQDLRLSLVQAIPPLVPDEEPLIRRPSPIMQVVRGVPAGPPLMVTFPIVANPTVAAPDITESLHEFSSRCVVPAVG